MRNSLCMHFCTLVAHVAWCWGSLWSVLAPIEVTRLVTVQTALCKDVSRGSVVIGAAVFPGGLKG